MSEERSTFVVALRDETSGPASDAAAALRRLEQSIQSDMGALRQMQGAMRALKGSSAASKDEVRALQERIDAQRASIASSHASYLRLGGDFRAVGKAAQGSMQAPAGGSGSGGPFATLLASAKAAQGPIGTLGGQLEAITRLPPGFAVATGGAVALVALAGAAVYATRALVSLAVDGFRFAVTAADDARTAFLRLEGQLRGAPAAAARLSAAVGDVARTSSLSRAEIGALGVSLARAGMRGRELSTALGAAAALSATRGQEWAERFVGMARAAHRAGRDVGALADVVRSRFGGTARAMAIGLGAQSQRLREDLGAVFATVSLDRFLAALDRVTSLFGETTATGRALRTITSMIFTPIMDTLARLMPLARRFIQGLVIGGLLVAIAFVRLRREFADVFGSSTISQADLLMGALRSGVMVVMWFAGAIYGAAYAFLSLYRAALRAREIVAGLLDGSLVRTLVEGFRSLGSSIADGLVGGITSGVTRVRDAVLGLASQAQGAFADALQIRSPSRVFAQLGAHVAAGAEEGIEGGAAGVSSAARSLLEVPSPGARSGRGGSVSVHVAELHVHAGQGGAREAAESFVAELERALRGSLLEQGAA